MNRQLQQINFSASISPVLSSILITLLDRKDVVKQWFENEAINLNQEHLHEVYGKLSRFREGLQLHRLDLNSNSAPTLKKNLLAFLESFTEVSFNYYTTSINQNFLPHFSEKETLKLRLLTECKILQIELHSFYNQINTQME